MVSMTLIFQMKEQHRPKATATKKKTKETIQNAYINLMVLVPQAIGKLNLRIYYLKHFVYF